MSQPIYKRILLKKFILKEMEIPLLNIQKVIDKGHIPSHNARRDVLNPLHYVVLFFNYYERILLEMKTGDKYEIFVYAFPYGTRAEELEKIYNDNDFLKSFDELKEMIEEEKNKYHEHGESCGCGHHEGHEHHHHEEHHHEHGEGCGCGHHHHHADEVFESWGKEQIERLSRQKLEDILEKLSESSEYGVVLRAKGMIELDDNTWAYFDLVPGEVELRDGKACYTSKACVIGANLEKEKLEELFKA